jgi:hypothetical protein
MLKIKTGEAIVNPDSPLAFIQPWMAVVAAAVIAAAIIHKRLCFRPRTSLMRRILLVSAIYMLPVEVAWFFIVGMSLRFLAMSGYHLPGAIISACVCLGAAALGNLTLGEELNEARKLPPRW